ncbi:hypothetical protein QQF64_022384 [Cirrhinus molitorella]|uniref:Uncharacterized protein n=1 Tax=Cirrhinus molitorella TaxID=172907 RepID=A0ABR3L819_9TELE
MRLVHRRLRVPGEELLSEMIGSCSRGSRWLGGSPGHRRRDTLCRPERLWPVRGREKKDMAYATYSYAALVPHHHSNRRDMRVGLLEKHTCGCVRSCLIGI